jgi:hypothetical protein
MQSLFYLVEEADAHNRNGNFGPALKKYMTVNKVCVPSSASFRCLTSQTRSLTTSKTTNTTSTAIRYASLLLIYI